MGLGDEIMAAGQAKVEHAKLADPTHKIQICGQRWEARYHEIWDGLSYILQPNEHAASHKVRNGPNCRPYIQYPFSKRTGWNWTAWRARDHVGELFLYPPETDPGEALAGEGDYLVIEPNQKNGATGNRRWSWGHYAALATELQGTVKLVQLPIEAARPLPGVQAIDCDFRTACGYLKHSVGYVGADGGFHHAAAALGVGAVVIFGGCTSAENLGYAEHRNIVSDLPGTPCGRWLDCDHCFKAMSRITPEQVRDQVRKMLLGEPIEPPATQGPTKPRRRRSTRSPQSTVRRNSPKRTEPEEGDSS